MKKLLILVSYIEGISLLVLLFIAMPMKYLAGDPQLVRIVGMAHGILFMILVAMITLVAAKYKWPGKMILYALVTSSVPFGMIALDRRLRAEDDHL